MRIYIKTTMMKEPRRFVSNDIALLSQNIFRNRRGEKFSSDNIKLVFAGDIYKECEYVSAEIKNLVMGGMRYSDIAVLTIDAKKVENVVEIGNSEELKEGMLWNMLEEENE